MEPLSTSVSTPSIPNSTADGPDNSPRASSTQIGRAVEQPIGGLYMPVVLTACEEGGYEYHHGTIGYGVFTYAPDKEFRKAQAAREMKTLRYDQISDVKGPKAACRAPVLGLPAKTRSR